MSNLTHPGQATRFVIRYQSLFDEGRGYSFPCDEHGRVDMDSLSQAGRCHFLFARAMVGREFAAPVVLAA